MDIYILKDEFNNLGKEEREGLYSLKNDNTIAIKDAGKVSGLIVWDRENYFKKVYKQLPDKEAYERGNQ